MTGAAGRQLFGDRVADAVAARESQLVLGLDPDPTRLWPRAFEVADEAIRSSASPSECAARAVAAHCALAIEAAGDQCVAVKLQVACFERLGAAGWRALDQVAAQAREHGLLVIADAKRGDIDVTAAAYAEAFFGEMETPFGAVPSLRADALTVNPLLGSDSLTPLVARARDHGSGLFVIVRTSNPGAADIQGLVLSDGQSVSDRLAEMVAELGADGLGRSGLTDVGAVVGATAPGLIEALRERMPQAVFLLPGVGAQGGSIDGLAPAFTPGPAGGLISVSRGIVGAHERIGGEPSTAARTEAARHRERAWQLRP